MLDLILKCRNDIGIAVLSVSSLEFLRDIIFVCYEQHTLSLSLSLSLSRYHL